MIKSQVVGKIMATMFWDTYGILLINYKGKAAIITAENCVSLLERLRKSKGWEN